MRLRKVTSMLMSDTSLTLTHSPDDLMHAVRGIDASLRILASEEQV